MPTQQKYVARHKPTVQPQNLPLQPQHVDHSDPNEEACYHWNNTMNGGLPRETKKYGFLIAFISVWLFVFLISWVAYSGLKG